MPLGFLNTPAEAYFCGISGWMDGLSVRVDATPFNAGAKRFP
jgi:hypothetical protein